jgi:hypothetical protein
VEGLTPGSALAANASPWFREYVIETGFLARFPQYAAVIAGLVPVPSAAVRAMGVRLHDGRFQLHYNARYLRKNRRMIAGILQHEVHHIVFGHLLASSWLGFDQTDLLTLAHEMAANEPIRLPLPRGVIRWQQFTSMGTKAGQSSRERYELLARRRERQRQEGSRHSDPAPNQDQQRPARGNNRGRPSRRAESAPDAPPKDLQPKRGLRYLDHDPSAGPPGEDGLAALRKLLRESAERLAAAPAVSVREVDPQRRIAGRSLGDWFATTQLQPNQAAPPLDWRTLLREFVSTRGTGWTYRRPNRRQPQRIGQVPARTRRGTSSHPNLMVAIDTSASLDQAMLDVIAAELQHVAEHAELTIVECDSRIRRVYPFDGVLRDVQGRGGTDLRPPFQPELVRQHGAAGIVYFTDGMGPWPAQKPEVEVLWVLVGDIPFRCPFGRQVRMQCPSTSAPAQPTTSASWPPTATGDSQRARPAGA